MQAVVADEGFPEEQNPQPLCGYYFLCIPGFRAPESTITVCTSVLFSPSCDSETVRTGEPVMMTIVHEMMHACGNCSDKGRSSADAQATDCVLTELNTLDRML